MSGHHHLLRRGGVYYYRRRVPVHLIQAIGKKFIQLSLDTTKLKEARKLRVAKDLEWDARFDALGNGPDSVRSPDNGTKIAVNGPSWSERELAELVRDYVERLDERFRVRLLNDPPESEEQKEEMRVEAQFESQIIRDRNHPDGHRSVYLAGKEILGSAVDDATLPQEFWELVRRALLELSRRSLAQLDDDHQRAFFDQLFHPARPPEVSFGELAEQFLDHAAEEAAANRTSQKWIDKQRAILSLLREIIGDKTTVHNIDHDTCLRVRSMLARTPANRTKIYGVLPLDRAIERAAAEQRNLLSPVTQEQYLSSLRDVLDLAAKKRLISVNPAQGLKPLKRDTIPAGDKRRPFTIEQIKQFFGSKYYAECAKHPVPFAHDKSGWRFWLPLICLFMGMRPNEVAQMLVEDLKRSSKGTRYLDVAATADDDDGDHVSSRKSLKTASSRRKIPLHPELIAIGFLQFVESRKKTGAGSRLFPDLKPDKYGNHASYALKRFRDTYLPSALKLEPRQSFYSFRHSWRDALRRVDAQPATLQALEGWSQGKLASDDYGDKSDPDFQAKYMEQITFPGLDLAPLYPHHSKGQKG